MSSVLSCLLYDDVCCPMRGRKDFCETSWCFACRFFVEFDAEMAFWSWYYNEGAEVHG